MSAQEQMVSLRDVLEMIQARMTRVCEECEKLPTDDDILPEERVEGKLLYQRLDELMSLDNEMKYKFLSNRGN